DAVPISALKGEGLDLLRERMAVALRRGEQVHEIRLAAAQGDKIAWLHARGEVLDQQLDRDVVKLSVRLSPENWARFQALETA
ncbi:MAG: GTPase HflX, partial [Sphingomicrobium sp.]